MRQLGIILSDKGSKYAVSGAPVTTREDIDAVLSDLKQDKAYAKATHNTWAAILPTGGLKADDGESGAGAVILRMLERDGVEGHVVIVTRWYGGKKLGGDRFRHVQSCVREYLSGLG